MDLVAVLCVRVAVCNCEYTTESWSAFLIFYFWRSTRRKSGSFLARLPKNMATHLPFLGGLLISILCIQGQQEKERVCVGRWFLGVRGSVSSGRDFIPFRKLASSSSCSQSRVWCIAAAEAVSEVLPEVVTSGASQWCLSHLQTIL